MAHRVIFLMLQLCSLVTASTAECSSPKGCATEDDANSLLQDKVLQSLMTSPSDSYVSGPLIAEIKGMQKGLALIGSQDQTALMTSPLFEELLSIAASSEGGRNMTIVKTIKDMLVNTLLPGIMLARSDAQNEVNVSNQKIHACNNDTNQAVNEIAGYETTAETAKQTHVDCRKVEIDKATAKNTACPKVDAFMSTLVYPVPPSKDAPVASHVAHMKTALEFYKAGQILETLVQDCDQATKDFEAQHKQCDDLQDAFESHFCEYRTKLLTEKHTSEKCYASSKEAYEEEKAKKTGLASNWVAEYTSMKKIECFLDVWLHDNNVSTVNTAQVATCKAYNPPPDAVSITYPNIPPAVTISDVPVETYPGSNDFVTESYKEPSIVYGDVTECVSPSFADKPIEQTWEFSKLDGQYNAPPSSTEDYAGTSLEGLVSLQNGVQKWIVPKSGRYNISAYGASTEQNNVMPQKGRGAFVSAEFALQAGAELNIIVGQMGNYWSTGDGASGGGGASWVWITGAQQPLLVAGGAGGSREHRIDGTQNGQSKAGCLDGRLVPNPFTEPCNNNNNGGWSPGAHCDGGGGAGWDRRGSVGGEGAMPGYPPRDPTKPAAGGSTGGCGGHGKGGFGGGGAAGYDAGGGGGGYVGGDGGTYSGNPRNLPGTGGSSYLHSSATNLKLGGAWSNGDGSVSISY